MQSPNSNKKGALKKIIIASVCIVLIIGAIVWNMLTKGFDDTAALDADFKVSATAFITEFVQLDSATGSAALNDAANKKYSEKIIDVSGRVATIEAADTTLNIKFVNPDGAYIAFAFQQQDQAAVKNIKEGDSISIKGSCNGASFSSILGVPYITFKRSSLNQVYNK